MKCFRNCLSSAIDADRVNEAHPAFPAIVRQLAADEARILARLAKGPHNYVFTRKYDADRALFVGPKSIEIDDLPKDDLRFRRKRSTLYGSPYSARVGGHCSGGIKCQSWVISLGPEFRLESEHCQYRLTAWGERFVQACSARG